MTAALWVAPNKPQGAVFHLILSADGATAASSHVVRGARPSGVDQVGKGEIMEHRTLPLSKSRAVLITFLGAIATLSFASSTGLAAGDRAAGQQFFATHCSPCHATEPGANKVGPSLAGVVGRKSGSGPGYNYSPAL